MKQLLAIVAAFGILTGAAAAQQAEPPLGEGDSLVDFAWIVCTQAPESEICREADRILREQIIRALLQLGDGTRADGRDTIVLYLDHPDPPIRVAATAALARLRPDARDTPHLLRVLNDPVPAVRQAALAALSNSSDPATIPVVDRAKDDQGSSIVPDPPIDPGWLGVTLPPGAEPLRFADDRADGVVAFVNDASVQSVADYYSQLAGRPAFIVSDLKTLLLPEWARVPGMGFYQELGRRLESLGSLPQDQQMLAQIRMGYLMGMQQGELPKELGRWLDGRRWVDVRFVVLAVDPLLEMPSQLLVAYRDLQLGRTGFAVQWLPAFGAPVPPAPTFAAVPTPSMPDYNPAEVEATIWRAVAWRNSVAAYEAFIKSLPNSQHVPEARAALEKLKAEQAAQPAESTTAAPDSTTETPEAAGGETAGESAAPLPSEQKSVTTPAGVTLSTASPIRQMQPLVISFSGLDAARSPWASVVPKGTPDTQWTDWVYAYTAEGTLELRGQKPGDYEVRLYLESPRAVVARLDITVVSTASGPPAIALKGEAKANQPIVVSFANLPGDTSDWISIAAVGKSDSEYNDWKYTAGETDGEMTLRGQPAGEYELRAIVERPKREVVARMKITILP